MAQANRSTWLGNAGLHRMVALAALMVLPACATYSPAPPPQPTVPAAPPMPQAPAAAPTKPVTQAPLGAPAPGATAPGGPPKVGLLLPLSGNGANVGSEMLNAAQMALFDLGNDRLALLPRDTKGSPTEAAEAARQLIQDGARLLLGPLFSTEVAAVKPVAQAAGVDVLAFSNDWTRAGDGTFVMGLIPADQVSRIIGFAQMRGLSRLALLTPHDAYGDAVQAAVHDSAQRLGVTVVREERYGKDNVEMASAVARLAAGGYDALLIAEGGERLKALVPMLAANHIDTGRVRLLGTALWDDPTIGRLPGLTGAWYAAPAPQTRADFEGRFEALYHHRPQRLATLAYDATALAAVLARNPATAGFDQASLSNSSGFSGLDGIFRLSGTGLVERKLAVIEIGPEGPRVIDQAPTSFEAVTN